MQKNDEQLKESVELIDRKKLTFVDPKEIIELAQIKPGEKVADFGCGPGYFSLPAAEAVGEAGTVYAFDVLPSALEAIESHIKIKNVDNVVIKRVNLEKLNGTGLENDSMDWVIIKDVLFQNKNKNVILQEAKRILKSGGSVLLMEWNENVFIGPDKESRISKNELAEIVFNEGFVFKTQANAGDYHYIIIASKM
ncbi:MAG: Methyltransferase type 11 [Candidatus Moranbacteria bacterium GW2011_GWE1_35_17]|nr:MAG: Methyltransferase type 11 [Candidatus Moranbacteria bacterium GW2011_GWE2_35_164]KKP68020.1 MAG: Methyltransferase type 11 [Candidatus Moranbacteria bacterium GW2011_GWE1_35_17]KKP80608.1 MAG: Methyltransferase type 11 [Candidatus Moranbacteria bacterium GW2011_GWF1_35_5]KKP81732.1 MAG: Methyltransferase type 11 [Candidatus Moranbacteria bacterium GW2011_GWF2_35_54]